MPDRFGHGAIILLCLAGTITTGAAEWFPSGAVPRPGDWLLARHDAANSAVTILDHDPPQAARAWTHQLSRHVFGYRPGMSVWSSAAVGDVGGRAVVAAGSYDHNLYLFDAAEGNLVWRFTTGNGVYSAPLIWKDGEREWIFVASSDRLIYGLDAVLGNRRWSRAVAGYQPTLGGSRLSAPCLGLSKGTPAVFVGYRVWDKSLANSTQSGGLIAVAARSGERLWQVDFLDNSVSDPVFAVFDDHSYVFAASSDGNLRALDADSGKLLWFHRETEPIMGAPLFYQARSGPRVIIGSHFGKLRCLDAHDGREIWSFKTGNWITGAAALYRSGGRDLVAFGSYDRHLYVLEAESGRKVFAHLAAGPVYSSPAVVPLEPEPQILYAAWDNRIYCLSGLDGTQLWTLFTGQPLWDAVAQGDSNWSSPVAARIDGRWMLYHGSYNGVFYAIPLAQAATAVGAHPWTNLRFWVTMFLAMAFSGALAFYLDRRRRGRTAVRVDRKSPRE
ncbi:MAG TPA: PQQ-binding-like beta-propeller repeat protein [Myxococcota bacterium]|nr:PQQ-binding-like beta-propeller repeat protein [Myxococcota bacterium]